MSFFSGLPTKRSKGILWWLKATKKDSNKTDVWKRPPRKFLLKKIWCRRIYKEGDHVRTLYCRYVPKHEYEELCVVVEHRGLEMIKESIHVFESQRTKFACFAPLSLVATGINTTTIRLLLLHHPLLFRYQKSQPYWQMVLFASSSKSIRTIDVFLGQTKHPYRHKSHSFWQDRLKKDLQCSMFRSGLASNVNSLNDRSSR